MDQPFFLHQLEHRRHRGRGDRSAAPQGSADLLQLRGALIPEHLQDLQLPFRRLRPRRPGHRDELLVTQISASPRSDSNSIEFESEIKKLLFLIPGDRPSSRDSLSYISPSIKAATRTLSASSRAFFC